MGQSGVPTTAGVNPSFEATRHAAQRALDQGQLAEALALLSPWHGDRSLSEPDRRELTGLLGQLAGTVIYSTGHYTETAVRNAGG